MHRKVLRFCLYCGAAFEKKHIEGRSRLVCTQCKEIHYQNPFPAATALVLNRHNQILLGKRAVEPAKGAWCLPGGFIEFDETMEQAALRELLEETGLKGEIVSFVGCFYQKSTYYGGVIIFGYRVEAVHGETCAGDDMEELMYCSLERLPPIAFDSHCKLIARLQEQLKI